MPQNFGLTTLFYLLISGFQRLSRLIRSEGGFAGTELALLSVVVSGSVLATAVVNTGTFSSEQIEGLVHSSVDKVGGTMEVRGAVIVTAKGAPLRSDTIQFTVGTFGNLQPIPMDPAQPGGLVISFRDSASVVQDVPYTVRFGAASNGDNNLDGGEIATIVIKVADLEQMAGQPVLAPGKRWTLDLESPNSVSLEFTRTQPSIIQPVMAQP